jgi:hypothetical protein
MGPTGKPKRPTITCQVCGTQNPATREFCRKCAADLHAPIGVATEPLPPLDAPSPMKPVILGGGLALLAVVVLAGTFMVLSGIGVDATPSPAPTASPTPVPATPTAAPISAPPITAPPEPTASPAPPEPTPGPSVRPPRIRLFVAPESIPCADPSHSGFIHVRWEIRNATGVTISIDGPGIYKEYEGLTGEDDLPFSCGQSHTYLLTTVGGVGPAATRERVVEPEPTGG